MGGASKILVRSIGLMSSVKFATQMQESLFDCLTPAKFTCSGLSLSGVPENNLPKWSPMSACTALGSGKSCNGVFYELVAYGKKTKHE